MLDPELPGAEQRDVAEPQCPGGRGGELGGDVVGRGEDDAHEVVVGDLVALQHLRDQPLRLGVDLRFGVLVNSCRAAQGQDFHGIGG